MALNEQAEQEALDTGLLEKSQRGRIRVPTFTLNNQLRSARRITTGSPEQHSETLAMWQLVSQAGTMIRSQERGVLEAVPRRRVAYALQQATQGCLVCAMPWPTEDHMSQRTCHSISVAHLLPHLLHHAYIAVAMSQFYSGKQLVCLARASPKL